ncbi:MAG: hypothetical protein IK111_09370 [Lachnospiraceae bacterium]|nr:hypothetical protein [Lachnospiraceae bacterium]
MGKFANGFSKALALILAAAMVMTGVPTSVFGADVLEPAGESSTAFDLDDISGVSDVADTVDDISTSESYDSNDTSSIDDLDATMEREEGPGRDKETDDIETLYFLNKGTDTATPGNEVYFGTDSHVAILDPLSRNGETAYLGADATHATAASKWDGDTDFSFVVVAEPGYYIDQEAVLVNIGHVADMSAVTTSFNPATDFENNTTARKGLAYTVDVAADKATATITIKRAYLQNYRTVKSSKSVNYGLLIQIPATAGKAKSYTMKVSQDYPAPIPENLLKVTVGQAFTPITNIPTNYIVGGKKITGVRIFIGDGPNDPTAPTNELEEGGGKDFTYSSGTLTMLADGILAGAELDEGLTIVFQSNTYSITGGFATTTAWDGSDSSLKFTEGAGTTGISTFDKNATNQADIKATLETDNADRILKSIKVTHLVSNVEKTATFTNTASPLDKDLVIPKSYGDVANQSKSGTGWGTEFASNLTVEAVTAEKVTATVSGTGYVITKIGGESAASTSYAQTGKELVIEAKTTSGKKISKIEYVQTVNGSAVTKDATDNGDGTWTVPASAMVRTTEIKVTAEADEETTKTVKKVLDATNSKNTTGSGAIDIDSFVVTGIKFGSTITSSGVPDKQDGQAYAFKVKPTSPAIIKAVGYRELGSTADATPLTATKVATDGTAFYSIPATFAGPAEIVITGSAEVAVTKSANPKVDIMVNGTALGTTNTTEKGAAFTFAVVPKASNVTVTKVQYSVGGGTKVDAGALRTETTISGAANPYTIAAAEVSGAVAIYVQTTEAVTDGGEYIVDFTGKNAPGKIITATPENTNVNWDFAYDATTGGLINDATDITGKKRNSNALLLNQNATATLTPQILKNDSTYADQGTVATTEFEVSDGSEDVIKVTSGTTTGTVQGIKFGSSKTVNYVVTEATADANQDENLIKISGSQKVDVKPRAVIIFDTPSQEFVDKTGRTISAYVQSGVSVGSATKYTSESALTAGLGGFAKTTVQSTSPYKWTPVNGSGVAVYADWAEELSTTAYTRNDYSEATDPTDPVSFNLELKDSDGTVYKAATPAVLYPMEVKNYIAVPVVTVTDGGEYYKATSTQAGTAVTIAVEDLNKADITYTLYEVSSAVAAADLDTATKVATLTAAAKTATKWARPVDATWTYSTTSNLSAYVTGSGNANVYSVEALKQTAVSFVVSAEAKVGHVKVYPQDVTFTVDKNQGLKKILMKINDAAQLESDGTTVTALALNDKYYEVNDTSVSVTPVYTSGTPADEDKVNNGYTFRVTANSEFTLPTQDDFVSTDKSRVLVGWSITTQNDDDILGMDAGTNEFAPGAKVVVTGDLATAGADGALSYGIAPIWADRYSVYTKDTTPVPSTVGVGTLTTVTTAPGFYIDLGEKDSSGNPVTTAKLGSGSSPVVNTHVRKDGKTPIGATVVERLAMSTDASVTADSALTYPAAGTTAGTITWIAYDAANSTGLNPAGIDTRSTALAAAEILNPSAAQAVSLGINTVLDPTELAKGNLMGKSTADGTVSSWLHAVYNFADGKKVVSDQPVKITLDTTDAAYSVFIDGLSTATTSGVEVGQTIHGSYVEIFEGVVSTPLADGNKYGFTWKVTPEDALTIEPSADSFAGNLAPNITVNKKPANGKVKVQLTYNDLYGKSATSQEIEFTVKDPSYQIKLVADSMGTAMTTPLIEAEIGGSTNFYVQLLDGTGTPVSGSGTWAWTSKDTGIIGDSTETGNIAPSTGLVKTGIIANKTGNAAIDTLDATTITLTYKTGSSDSVPANTVYTLSNIPAKTFSTVTFDATTHAQLTADTNALNTTTGTPEATKIREVLGGQLDDSGKITASVSGTAEEAGTSAIKKYYKDDVVGGKFVLDTTPYTAAYTGTGKEYIEFAGWQISTTNSGIINTANPAVTKLEVSSPNKVVLYPNFTDTPVTTISTNVDKIVLDNAKTGTTDFELFTVSTTDKTTIDKIYFTNKGDYPFVKAAPQNESTALSDGTGFTPQSTRNTKTQITYSADPKATDSNRTYVFGVSAVTGQAGKATFTLSSQNSSVTHDVTVVVKGEYTASDSKKHYMLESGEDAKDTAVEITAGTVHYYDADGAEIVDGVAKDADGNYVALKNRAIQKGYQPNVDGKGHATYSDPTTGIITPNAVAKVDGVNTYFIDENGLIAVPTLAGTDTYGLIGKAPTQYIADSTGKILTEAAFKALGVESVVIGDVEYIVGANDLALPAKAYYYTSHKFTWKWNTSTLKPDVTVTVKYTADDNSTREDTDVTVTDITAGPVKGNYQQFTAKYVAKYPAKGATTPKELSEIKTYDITTGKPGSGGDDGEKPSPSEPEQQSEAVGANYNLFYNNSENTVALEVPAPNDVDASKVSELAKADKAWTTYWTYDSGTVTLKASTAKERAAAAKYNTIVLPRYDASDNFIGDFEYALPVTYVKPALKLSSSAGMVYTNNSEDQPISTSVTMLASSGLYEPLDLTSFDNTAVSKIFTVTKGDSAATAEVDSTDGDKGKLNIAAKNAASGLLNIKLDNWSEAITLKYAVKAVAKDTLTATAPVITLNSNVKGVTEEFETTIMLNGKPVESSDSITIEPSKNWATGNFEYDDTLFDTTGTLKFGYKTDSTPVAGKYSLTFTKGKAKTAVTIVVNKAILTKAVAVKVKTTLNAVTGQKMVIVPTLKGIGGHITDAEIADSSSIYEATYDDVRNQIIVGVKSGETATAGSVFNETINITASGVVCPVAVKTKIASAKIAVKVPKVTLPKSKLSSGDATGETNILATYKIGKKTFTIDPTAVKFMDGKEEAAEDPDNTGWYKITSANVRVQYDKLSGKIEVVPLSGAQKVGAVVVKLTFPGNLTVNAKVPVTINKNK